MSATFHKPLNGMQVIVLSAELLPDSQLKTLILNYARQVSEELQRLQRKAA